MMENILNLLLSYKKYYTMAMWGFLGLSYVFILSKNILLGQEI